MTDMQSRPATFELSGDDLLNRLVEVEQKRQEGEVNRWIEFGEQSSALDRYIGQTLRVRVLDLSKSITRYEQDFSEHPKYPDKRLCGYDWRPPSRNPQVSSAVGKLVLLDFDSMMLHLLKKAQFSMFHHYFRHDIQPIDSSTLEPLVSIELVTGE